MSNILTAVEMEESVDWTVRIARGANVSEHTDASISMLLAERDRLLCRERDLEEIEYEDAEVDAFWDEIERR